MEELQNAAKGYELRYNSRAAKLDAAKQNADKLGLDAEEKMRRARLLEELERNMEGFAHSVKAVVKQAERGVLRGILGPVSRLIRAEADYALAVETALGGAAQNLVCEKEDDAKRAIAYLKENKGGRATFLPLTSVKGNLLSERGLENEPGFVGLASSLVTLRSRLRGSGPQPAGPHRRGGGFGLRRDHCAQIRLPLPHRDPGWTGGQRGRLHDRRLECQGDRAAVPPGGN